MSTKPPARSLSVLVWRSRRDAWLVTYSQKSLEGSAVGDILSIREVAWEIS